ncbi:MAG: hypothetical protein R3D83_07175 [Caenibius sp.]
MEKALAARTGIGGGASTPIVSRKEGSWLFLGAIYTELEFTAKEPHADRCGTCDAPARLPTAAFPAPYQLGTRRCISYLRDRAQKGPIPHEFRKASAIASMVATIAWLSAPGTALPSWARATRRSCRAPSWPHRGWRSCSRSTMRRFAGFSPARRSSGSGALAHSRHTRCGPANSARPDALAGPVRALLGDADETVAEAARWALSELEGVISSLSGTSALASASGAMASPASTSLRPAHNPSSR